MNENPVIAKEKIVLVNSLSPGDILMMTPAIRSLHVAYPGRFEVDVRSPCNEIFQNSPYITRILSRDPRRERDIIEELKKDLDRRTPIEENGVKFLIAHYPEINRSGVSGAHFSDGHRLFLAEQLGIEIPSTGMRPDIFFSDAELKSENPMHKFSPYRGRYWVINAGVKSDYTLKWYNHYQEVIDLMKDKIQFVQIGQLEHNHPALNGVIDMRGKTSLRQLFRVIHDADGVLTCVSMPMVAAAALNKPCVVISGAREGVRWQLNPDHQFLYRNGTLPCAEYDGCWRSRTADCINKHKETNQPMCMELITPEDVCRAIELYYLGGRLTMEKPINVTTPKLMSAGELNTVGEVSATLTELNKMVQADKIEENIIIPTEDLIQMSHAAIFNTLRILKKYNPDDKYYESYKWHYAKRGEDFMDSYHMMWWIGSKFQPKRVLEIGCRTGVSICQLLSAYHDYSDIEKVVLCDLFAELGSESKVIDNLQVLNIPTEKVSFMKESSLDAMPKLIQNAEKFDYILVDGCHDKDYAAKDLDNAYELINKGGFILFDDLTPDGCSLQDVWDAFKAKYEKDFYFTEDHHGKGIGVAKRK